MWSLRLIRAGDASETVVEERSLSRGRITFGRGADVDWKLADPNRVISKNHCHILSADDGSLQLVDTSSNGVFVNGTERAPMGRSMDLRSGDRVRIGDYIVAVNAASVFGDASVAPQAARWPGSTLGNDPFASSLPAPFAPSFPQSFPAPGGDPFGSPLPQIAPRDPFATDPSQRSSFERAGWGPDPDRRDTGWQEPPAPPRRTVGPLNEVFERPLMAERGPERAAFEIPTGWNAWTTDAPLPPAATEPITVPGMLPARPAVAAPAYAPPPAPPVVPQQQFTPPPVAQPPVVQPQYVQPPQLQPHYAPPPYAPPPEYAPPHYAQPQPAPLPPALPPAQAAPVAAPAAGADYAAGVRAGEANALAWLVAGAGLDPAKFNQADVQSVMSNAGEAYAQAILGIADVLRDRAFTKSQFRIQQTIVGVGNNNPLKFLPPMDAAVALLRPIIPGLMGPQLALNAACADMKKHQLAVMAGLRAALRAVFDGLNPAQVEALAKKKSSGFGSLTEGGRQAKAWVEYSAFFKNFEADASDSADSLVNREFRRGYEDYFAKLDQIEAAAAKDRT